MRSGLANGETGCLTADGSLASVAGMPQRLFSQ